MKTSLLASFLTLAATSLLLNPSASAVEAVATEAIPARAETAETKCSDNGSNIKCPPIRKDSETESQSTASPQYSGQAQIKVASDKKTERDCKDPRDDSGTVCPAVTNSGRATGQ